MTRTRFLNAAALAAALTVGSTAAALAGSVSVGVYGSYGHTGYGDHYGSYHGGSSNNFAQGQHGYDRPDCDRDFYGTYDCGPNPYGNNFGPDDREHAFELGHQIQR